MNKRITVLFLAGILLLHLCACGSGTSSQAPASVQVESETALVTEQVDESDPVAAEEPSQTEEPAATVAEEPSETNPEELEKAEEEEWIYVPISYPLTTETISLDYWAVATLSPSTIYNDYNEHKQLDLLAEATGVRLNFYAQTNQTPMDLMIASGDYPDLIGGISYSTGISGAIEDDVVVDVKEYLPSWAPDYYRWLMADNQAAWNAVQTNEGYIGVFTTVNHEEQIDYGPMVFQFMLDDLGYTANDLGTLDVLEEFLLAVKDKYGIAAPLYLPGDFIYEDNVIVSAYDVALKIDAYSGDLPWYVKDGQVKFGYLEDGFTEYVTRMNDWYSKGILDSDTASHPTTQNDDIIELVANKQVGVFHRPSGLIDLLTNLSGEAIVPIPYPTMEAGQTLPIGGVSSNITSEDGLVISTGCDDLELAIKFINYLYTDEFFIPGNYGIEGESYALDENGDPYFLEWTYSTPGTPFSAILMDYVIFTMVDANVPTPGLSDAALSCLDVWNANLTGEENYPDAATLLLDENDTYSQHISDITAMIQEHTAKFIIGDEPLNNIGSFQQTLIDVGIEELIAVKQAAYDRYMSKE